MREHNLFHLPDFYGIYRDGLGRAPQGVNDGNSQYKGKCGECEFNKVCGGSRARAYALTGDHLESEPYCTYIPQQSVR